jgi:prephenate dehydrogenase
MGGSLGLAIKRCCPDVEVIGVDRTEALVNRARARGAIDWGTCDLKQGVAEADLIFLATPIGAILELLPPLADCIAEEAIVSDLGSTKVQICLAAQKLLPENFVGGHPMAGSEHQGIEAADPFLFENAIYILTPLRPSNDTPEKLAAFLEQLGVSVLYLSPERHDRLVAHVSHLPQLLAVALVDFIREKSEGDSGYKQLVAGGFRDMTRIAASPYEIWRDILITNRDEIEQALKALVARLQRMGCSGEEEAWRESFARAAIFRTAIPLRSKSLLDAAHASRYNRRTHHTGG